MPLEITGLPSKMNELARDALCVLSPLDPARSAAEQLAAPSPADENKSIGTQENEGTDKMLSRKPKEKHKKKVHFVEAGMLATTIIYQPTVSCEPKLQLNMLQRKHQAEASAIAEALEDEQFWLSIEENQLLEQITAAKQCSERQLLQLKALYIKVSEILTQAMSPDETWAAILIQIADLIHDYDAIIQMCNKEEERYQKPSAIAEHHQDEKEKERDANLNVLRDNTKKITTKTAYTNHVLSRQAETISTLIPDTLDIAKRMVQNIWDFIKNNKALFIGAGLILFGMTSLFVTPVAPLCISLIAIITGNLLLMGKNVVHRETISSTKSLTNASGGLWQTSSALSEMPDKISTIKQTSNLFSTKTQQKNTRNQHGHHSLLTLEA